MITAEEMRLIPDLEPLRWDEHAASILGNRFADLEIRARREMATKYGLAAIYFSEPEVIQRVDDYAVHEIATGRADRAVYVSVWNGGIPFHDALVGAMEAKGKKIRTDRIRTTAYEETTYVGAHVVEDEDSLPQYLQPGDEVVFTDDGIETAGSLIVSGEFIHKHYGVDDISALTAVTKQLGMIIAGFRSTSSMFATPFGPWGEGFGFDNNGKNRDTKVIGLSMKQPANQLDVVEHVLHVMGGRDGFAVATIDDIRRYNQN